MRPVAYAVLLAVLAATMTLSLVHAQQDQLPLIAVWKTDTDNQIISIPLVGSGMTVHRSDGASSTGISGTTTCAYADPATHTVSVYGDLQDILLDYQDPSNLVSVDRWGYTSWTTIRSAFSGAVNTVYRMTDAPDISHVTDTSRMFCGAAPFNQNLGPWYIALIDLAVSNDEQTVSNIVAQNQALTSHNPAYSVTYTHADLFEMVNGTNFRLKHNQNVILGTACQVNLTAAEPTDPLTGAPDHAFVTTWTTAIPNQTIRLPVTGYDITIDWGDGNTVTGVSGPQNHAYTEPGTYTVIVTGGLERFHLDNGPGGTSLSSINQWGNSSWTSMEAAFHGASNMVYRVTDDPVLSRVTDMSSMFAGAASFNGNISTWNVSSVTDMSDMFFNAASFNQPLNAWDTSSVTSMHGMFYNAASFNQPLDSWDTSSVTSMRSMFFNAASFNGNISTWTVSSVTDMSSMFFNAASFNQPLNAWDTSSVTHMAYMFFNAASFNGNISTWNVSSVIDMFHMFRDAASFNGDISSWNASSATHMTGMFDNATSFDQNLGRWYITIDSASIDRADVPGVVGAISALNLFLDWQNPVYQIEPGIDSDRFIITDDNLLSMVSAAAGQTDYEVTIAATRNAVYEAGWTCNVTVGHVCLIYDAVFEDGNNRRTVYVTLVG